MRSCLDHLNHNAVGVCAFCLREKLLALIAEREREAEALQIYHGYEPPIRIQQYSMPSVTSEDAGIRHYNHQFFSTPQVDTTRRSSISSLSKPKLEEKEKSSWFSSIFRRKKKKFSTSSETRDSELKISSSESGYSSEISGMWRKTMSSTQFSPIHIRRRQESVGRNGSDMAFCWSPLVSSNPNCRNQMPAMGFSGELRGSYSQKPFPLTESSFSGNRSRKSVGFRRYL